MLYTRRIRSTLIFLDREYSRHISSYDQERPVIFSKLSVLELSGWIEEGFDEIARNCVRRKRRTYKSRDVLENKIKATHGFTYSDHARELLAVALGTVRLLEVEKELEGDGSLTKLRAELGMLNKQRQSAAHTFTKGTTRMFDSPSITLGRFSRVEPILQRLWDMGGSA